MNIGIFGGTFDPPHYGHLILASEAAWQLQLTRILWVVAGQSPFKIGQEMAAAEDRFSLVSAAIAPDVRFALSRVDIDRPAPHYTIETLQLLRTEYPSANFFLLVGEDSLADFARWREPSGILALCQLAVWRRPGTKLDLPALQAELPALAGKLHWLDTPQIDISSREIRRRVRADLPVQYLLPEAVQFLIGELGLYQ